MNDEEIIETLKTIANDGTIKYYYNDKTIENINNAINLIFKQQKEIKARLEEIDSLYKMMSVKDDEIKYLEVKLEQMGLDYQILKDDIEEHNIAYVDTPEFEEKYISKDKIRHIRDKAEVMDYYSLNDVIDDLSKLIGD